MRYSAVACGFQADRVMCIICRSVAHPCAERFLWLANRNSLPLALCDTGLALKLGVATTAMLHLGALWLLQYFGRCKPLFTDKRRYVYCTFRSIHPTHL